MKAVNPPGRGTPRRRGAGILYAFFAALGSLAVLIAVAYVGNLRLASLIDEEQEAFERNIYEQSSSLNRVVFAIHDLLQRPDPESGAAGFARLADLGRSALNQASIPVIIEASFLEGILGEDPLFLAERAAKSNDRYRAMLARMNDLLESSGASGDTAEGRRALRDFLDAAAAFMDELRDRSQLYIQIEGAFHSANRKNIARLHYSITQNLAEFSAITVLLVAIAILFFRSRMAIELEIKAHRDHLAELVAERTDELATANSRLRAALGDKEILLKEVYHRVKNNLAIVASLISLQQSEARPENLEEAFEKLGKRVGAIAMIHERLYRSADLSSIAFGEYVTELCQTLIYSLSRNPAAIALELASPQAFFNPDTLVPLGLIITELVTNSLKHAFVGRAGGRIVISLAETEGGYVLEVRDDGTPPADERAILESKSLGSVLVASLLSQIKGTLELDLSGGTAVTMRFPYARG
jgi:two-component sensor histidine kinase